MTAIRRLLIANRGEIACRIAATAQRMGIETVAVYSDADANARHVRRADRAVRIGSAPVAECYLRADAVVQAALDCGADAIHPGYGFLSENADFAKSVAKAGLIFVGPPAEAIKAMGSKSASKTLMIKAGVPLVPGYHGVKQDAARLAEEARRIGYPVLVKASAGGGGKGMRVVKDPKNLSAAIEGAKREAKASFGNARLMIEKYLLKARHVEVQIFGDAHGNYVHLFERDCSLQRRHQKVIEEAPAPGMTDSLRAAMGKAAVDAARAVGYVGAGTVEFLLVGKEFFFIEMNTRLQVEHPVTEAITGTDLVDWQLRVAAGETLPMAQEDLSISGHAFEARLYAEDPDKGYLPQTGTLHHLVFSEGDGVRIDSGVDTGDAVSVHYDPMIAKIIVHGADRAAARARLVDTLRSTRVAGVETNLDFLIGVAETTPFRTARIDTGWLDRMKAPKGGWRRHHAADTRSLALAALYVIAERGRAACRRAERSGDPHSPWFRTDGWRLIDRGHQDIYLCDLNHNGKRHHVAAVARDGGYELGVGDETVVAALDEMAGISVIDGARMPFDVIATPDGCVTVYDDRGRVEFRIIEAATEVENDAIVGGGLTAPMPGKVTAVYVKKGDKIKRGAPLLVLEAMKMEHTVTAPDNGIVTEVRYAVGDQVEEGSALAVIELNG